MAIPNTSDIPLTGLLAALIFALLSSATKPSLRMQFSLRNLFLLVTVAAFFAFGLTARVRLVRELTLLVLMMNLTWIPVFYWSKPEHGLRSKGERALAFFLIVTMVALLPVLILAFMVSAD